MSNPYAPPDPNKPRPVTRPPSPAAGPTPPRRPPDERPEATAEQTREATRKVTWFGLLMLTMMLATYLPMPYVIAAPLVGAGAIWYGVHAATRVRSLRLPGLLLPLLIGGLALSSLMVVTTTTRLTLFWDQEVALAECRDRAITISAQHACEQDYEDALRPATPSEG